MIDAPKEIRDMILADGATSALVSSRVWAQRTVPPVGYTPGDGAGIAFNTRGGQQTFEAEHQLPSVQFKIYAATEKDANTAYQTLHAALNHQRYGSKIVWAEAENYGVTLREPETDWIFVLAYFTFTVRDL